MKVYQREHFDPEILADLVEELREHYAVSEGALIALERDPFDMDLLRRLFRSVHTIKGNLGVVGLRPVLPLVSAVEDLLGALRERRLHYDPLISDLVLLVLDRVRQFVEQCLAQGFGEYDELLNTAVANAVDTVLRDGQGSLTRSLAGAVRRLDPSVSMDADPQPAAAEVAVWRDRVLVEDEDIAFFRNLNVPVEERSRFWAGRADRILRLVLALNQQAGAPVDPQQLAVAVYVHDFGMAFVPLPVLHKQSVLSDDEILLVRAHVQASANLLQSMPRWAPARDMVMQHHESVDGSGYPFGLREREICEGAKLIALADTFEALTHARAHLTHQKRPILRAVKEINGLAGRQLSAHWVDVFNKTLQPVLLAQHRVTPGNP